MLCLLWRYTMTIENLITIVGTVLDKDRESQIPRQRWRWRYEEVLAHLKDIQHKETK